MSRAGTEFISVFEHEVLRLGRGDGKFSAEHLAALQHFHGRQGQPYYSLIHNGVKFNEYVGVLQVGRLTIEVLPKADKHGSRGAWREILLAMLRSAGVFSVHAPGTSMLRVRSNSILDLYFELFIREAEEILHRGLIKQYRKSEGNSTTLKGSLVFAQQIRQNLVHRERFYVRHTKYDYDHRLNRIIYKTLRLLNAINTSPALSSRIGALMLNFPELPDISVNDALFSRISFSRQTEMYTKAIQIARLLLLNFHPDLNRGKNDVLALMFDMNLLWERFIAASLYRFKPEGTILKTQTTKNFWQPSRGRSSGLRPDIVISAGDINIVLDTKWKKLDGTRPSAVDLRQMYSYSKFYHARSLALIYPGNAGVQDGFFYSESGEEQGAVCKLIAVKVKDVNAGMQQWQKDIANRIFAEMLGG